MKYVLCGFVSALIAAGSATAQIQDLIVVPESNAATISWNMAAPSIPSLDYGQTLSYELGTLGGGATTNVSIDFADIAVPVDSDIDGADFESGGFTFDITNDHSNFANGNIVYSQGPAASNGGTYFFVHGYYLDGWVEPSLSVSSTSGNTFDLLSLTLSEYVLFADAAEVEIIGHYPSGSTVSMTVQLDGILDGAGGADDFQSVSFDGSWASLSSVEFFGHGGSAPFLFAIDDLQITETAPLLTSASFDITGLVPGTTYFFRAQSIDALDNVSTAENSFETSSVGGGNPPLILTQQINPTDLTATFEWTTDQPTVGTLAYGLTTQYELGNLSTTLSSQTLDFEDLGIPADSDLDLPDFSSGGFDIDISDDEATFVNGEFFFGSSPAAYNGSTYFFIYGSYNGGWGYPTATITHPAATPFSLHRLDYSEAATFVAATKMVVTGQTVGGQTLRQTFFLDGIIDGVPGPADFQTAVFDSTWVDLLSVTIQAEEGASGALLAIDNVVLNEASAYETTHTFSLAGLTHGTQYHAQMFATDADGDVASTGDLVFTTTSVEDHDAPAISNILVVSEYGNATVSWDSDELVSGSINYGLTESYGVHTATPLPTLDTVDFEDISVPVNSDIDAVDFMSGGYVFDISNDHSNFANGDKGGWNYNGTTYFFIHGFYSQGWVVPHFTVTRPSGGTFTLKQFDIGEVFMSVAADVVRVTGVKSSGAQLVRDITLDDILDGPGGADDFQTEVFDLGWNELVSLKFQAVSGTQHSIFAIDELVILNTEDLTKTPSVLLSNLGLNLVYHYEVTSIDEAGNVTVEPDRIFTSGQTNDAAAPQQTNIVISPSSDSVTVTWDTNEWAQGSLDIGTTQSLELGNFGGNTSGIVTIDFEQNFDAVGLTPIPVPFNDDTDADDFVSGNYLFDIDDDHSNFLDGEVFFLNEPVSYNGTTIFFVHGHYNNGWVYPVVEMTSLQSSTFTLVQLDVSEATFLANADQVLFTGTKQNGSTVQLLHDVDMILDGSGPDNDFETLTFDSQWEDLASLKMQATGGFHEAEVVYDNIVVRQGGGVNHSVTVTGLAPDTLYYLQVNSVDAASNETISAIMSFTTLP